MGAPEQMPADAVAEAQQLHEEDSAPLLARCRSEALQLEATSTKDELEGTFWDEVIRVIKLAGPLALQDCLIVLQGAVTVAFVGRLDARSLSAMVLTSSVYNITGLSFVMGAASGAETLSGQCYGAKNYGAVGVVLQRSLLIMGVTGLFVLLLWTQVHSVLIATGQDPIIAAMAVEQMWLCTPAMFATGATECLKRYLMAQEIVVPTCMVYLVSTSISPFIDWVIIFGLGLGFHGAAIALDIVSLLNCLALLGYITYHNSRLEGTGRETWLGWSWECFRGWGEYIGLAVPSTIMMCLEWWLYECIILMTGGLAEAEINLGVAGVVFQIASVCYMPPIGLQGAICTRTSNELGDGRPKAAKRAMHAGLVVGLCSQVTLAIALFFGRSVWGYALSSDPEVVRRVAGILFIISFMLPSDGLIAVSSGVVRGCGRQLVAACMNVFTYWGVGIPLAAYLGFRTPLGVSGLWIGVVTVAYVQLAALSVLISCLNWDREAERAARLVERNTPQEVLDSKLEAVDDGDPV